MSSCTIRQCSSFNATFDWTDVSRATTCDQERPAEGGGWRGLVMTARLLTKGACTHTGKTGAESDSGAGCSVNKWVFSHAAGPAELPVRHTRISVLDFNSTSREPGRRPAYQFQCNCFGTCTRVWTCRCPTTVLNASVCIKHTPILCTNIFLVQRSKSTWPPAAVMPVRVKNSTTVAGSDSGKKPVCVQAP
jgi:hypothetical protein